MIKNKIENSVVNKSTYSTRMKDVKTDTKGKSTAVSEPKSGSKSKNNNKNIRPPTHKKPETLNKSNIKNNDNFIDKQKLRKQNEQKVESKKSQEDKSDLKNMESHAEDSEIDNSIINDIKGLTAINKTDIITPENQQLIDE